MGEMLQLNPSIAVDVKDRGPGRAVGWLDQGADEPLIWVVILDGTRTLCKVPSTEVSILHSDELNLLEL